MLRCLGAVYSITTFIRDLRTLLQIRQFAHLRSTTCSLQGLISTQRSARAADCLTAAPHHQASQPGVQSVQAPLVQSAFMAMVAPPWLPWRRHGSSSQRSGRGLEAAGTQAHAPRAPGHHVQPLTWPLLSSPAVVCTAGPFCSVGWSVWSVDAMRSVRSGLDRITPTLF